MYHYLFFITVCISLDITLGVYFLLVNFVPASKCGWHLLTKIKVLNIELGHFTHVYIQ